MSENASNVVVSPAALALMSMHALTHPTAEVHGLLIGKSSGGKTQVTSAYPVCHESPTKPLVDIAITLTLSLLDESSASDVIVGWYAVPELAGDTKPNPAALRIVSGLEEMSSNPVLVTVSKLAVANLASKINGGGEETFLQAFGKDFGGQYMKEIDTKIESEANTVKAIEDLAEQEQICDLADHWMSPHTKWPNLEKITKHLA